MVTFYLVRHGQKEQDRIDPPLTQLGVRQAQRTAEHFAGRHFEQVLVSPQARTKHTAEIIIAAYDVPIIHDDRITERIERTDALGGDEFWEEWMKSDNDRDYIPSVGYSSRANGARFKALLDEVEDGTALKHVLVVTHGGTIGDVLRTLFGEDVIEHKYNPESGVRYVDILECSVTTITKNNGDYQLVGYGSTHHLS